MCVPLKDPAFLEFPNKACDVIFEETPCRRLPSDILNFGNTSSGEVLQSRESEHPSTTINGQKRIVMEMLVTKNKKQKQKMTLIQTDP